MVDTSGKAPTLRSALARAVLRFPPGVLARLLEEGGPKGPVGEVARLAGIAAAKRVDELIPLCHALALDHVEVRLEPLDGELLQVSCSARAVARTGVEMEAMVGAATAALAVYDMSKALDKGIVVERVELLEKAGGRSGPWRKEAAARPGAKARRS
ncbi:MAG: cyclic pyranopterin monophosphate synthase MoaC [Planctomycetia bacterium]|jgi:cyclic pyranopterin phosphate synthase